MPNHVILNNDNVLITASDEKKHVMIELSTSGYRPRVVSMYFESEEEINTIINALIESKKVLKK